MVLVEVRGVVESFSTRQEAIKSLHDRKVKGRFVGESPQPEYSIRSSSRYLSGWTAKNRAAQRIKAKAKR